MFRQAVASTLAALLAACATGEKPRAPVPVRAPAPAQAGAPNSVKVNSLEQKIIQSVNALRSENKLPSLKSSVQLMAVAQSHARNMARQDKYGDTDRNGHILDGKHFEDRIKVSGYPFLRVAENVGYELGKSDPADAMVVDWKDSPGHRRNMLTPEFTEIGVGAAQGSSGRWYFVQVFGRPQPPIKQAGLNR